VPPVWPRQQFWTERVAHPALVHPRRRCPDAPSAAKVMPKSASTAAEEGRAPEGPHPGHPPDGAPAGVGGFIIADIDASARGLPGDRGRAGHRQLLSGRVISAPPHPVEHLGRAKTIAAPAPRNAPGSALHPASRRSRRVDLDLPEARPRGSGGGRERPGRRLRPATPRFRRRG